MKPRTMKRLDGSQSVEVYGWFMTQNLWEYFLLDNKRESDIRFALVDGYEQEAGDISRAEIAPYVIMSAALTDLMDMLPARGWTWVD